MSLQFQNKTILDHQIATKTNSVVVCSWWWWCRVMSRASCNLAINSTLNDPSYLLWTIPVICYPVWSTISQIYVYVILILSCDCEHGWRALACVIVYLNGAAVKTKLGVRNLQWKCSAVQVIWSGSKEKGKVTILSVWLVFCLSLSLFSFTTR